MKNIELKRECIKVASKKLFYQFGTNKTSMDDIAKQCQIAKSTLYYYYENNI